MKEGKKFMNNDQSFLGTEPVGRLLMRLAVPTVIAQLVGQIRGEKIVVYKYKSKKNYRRKQGHRQPYTKVEITKIG